MSHLFGCTLGVMWDSHQCNNVITEFPCHWNHNCKDVHRKCNIPKLTVKIQNIYKHKSTNSSFCWHNSKTNIRWWTCWNEIGTHRLNNWLLVIKLRCLLFLVNNNLFSIKFQNIKCNKKLLLDWKINQSRWVHFQ